MFIISGSAPACHQKRGKGQALVCHLWNPLALALQVAVSVKTVFTNILIYVIPLIGSLINTDIDTFNTLSLSINVLIALLCWIF